MSEEIQTYTERSPKEQTTRVKEVLSDADCRLELSDQLRQLHDSHGPSSGEVQQRNLQLFIEKSLPEDGLQVKQSNLALKYGIPRSTVNQALEDAVRKLLIPYVNLGKPSELEGQRSMVRRIEVKFDMPFDQIIHTMKSTRYPKNK